MSNPIATAIAIAGTDVLLTDLVGALVGLDPYVSAVSARVARIGLPSRTRFGDLAPYEDWENVPRFSDAVQQTRARDRGRAVLKMRPNGELFPFTNPAIAGRRTAAA